MDPATPEEPPGDGWLPSMAHEPQRTCVACRRGLPARDLVRIARVARGARLDDTRTLGGRGAYVCPRADCIAALGRRGGSALARALRLRPEDVASALDALNRRASEVPRSEKRE